MHNYQELINECSHRMADKKFTIAFAESATVGKLAFEFSLTQFYPATASNTSQFRI